MPCTFALTTRHRRGMFTYPISPFVRSVGATLSISFFKSWMNVRSHSGELSYGGIRVKWPDVCGASVRPSPLKSPKKSLWSCGPFRALTSTAASSAPLVVLEFLRQRLSNEQIAERTGITLDGAKYHVSQILSKLGVGTREEAAAWQLPDERRAWWGSWPLWVRIAGVGTIAAAVAGLAVLTWGVLRTSGNKNTLPGQTDVGDVHVCGVWSSASGTLGSTVTQRYGEIRNCGLFGDSWVINTLGRVNTDGTIGVYRCDSRCVLSGRAERSSSLWLDVLLATVPRWSHPLGWRG